LDPFGRFREIELRDERVLESAHDGVEGLGSGVEWDIDRFGPVVLSLRLRASGGRDVYL
jgi:hypothetical protein